MFNTIERIASGCILLLYAVLVATFFYVLAQGAIITPLMIVLFGVAGAVMVCLAEPRPD